MSRCLSVAPFTLLVGISGGSSHWVSDLGEEACEFSVPLSAGSPSSIMTHELILFAEWLVYGIRRGELD